MSHPPSDAALRPPAVSVTLRPVVLLLVLAGGAAGGTARYGLTLLLPGDAGPWPWAVLVANTGGAFLLAVLLTAGLARAPTDGWLRPALGTGVCGAFTTMSAVAVVAADAAGGADALTAAGFLAANAAGGLLAAATGVLLARLVLPPGGSR